MKKLKLSIIFGLVIIFNIITVIFVILKSTHSNIKYRMIAKDNTEYSDTILSYNQEEVDMYLSPSGRGININAKQATEIAQTRVFDIQKRKLKHPYFVYFDEENDVYMVLAEFSNSDSLLQVIICKKLP